MVTQVELTSCSVADPISLSPDPSILLNSDPDQDCCGIRIQYGSGSNQRFIMKTFKKYRTGTFFWSKTVINVLLNLSKDVQARQTWNFFLFSFFGGQFWPAWTQTHNPDLDPDPLTQLNPDPIRIWTPETLTPVLVGHYYFFKTFRRHFTEMSLKKYQNPGGEKALELTWARSPRSLVTRNSVLQRVYSSMKAIPG